MEAAHYTETRKALKRDPIILAMARELEGKNVDSLTHYDSDAPRHSFMLAALGEYHKRGGKVSTHIGGPAEAIIDLLREPRA